MMILSFDFWLLLLLWLPSCLYSFNKVVVPAHYHDFDIQFPDWITNQTIQRQYGYSVFLYQRENSSAPNYIGYNRAGENAIYYKFIVDHYHNFPDVAIFVHAKPHEHQLTFLNRIGCISPNASSSINDYFLGEVSGVGRIRIIFFLVFLGFFEEVNARRSDRANSNFGYLFFYFLLCFGDSFNKSYTTFKPYFL
jgi:hypothetical protein